MKPPDHMAGFPVGDAARAFGAAIIERAKPIAPYSRLYCRVNGFMFGVFFAMCLRRPARYRYRFYRARMHTFLDEIGIDDVPPRTHAEYPARFFSGVQSLTLKLGARSRELVDFFLLGIHTIERLVLPEGKKAREIEDQAAPILGAYELAAREWQLLSEHARKRARNIDELISPALTFLAETLRPLPVEPRTCFVAMPFRQPFEDQFASLYRPLLAATGYRAVRAWGGFGGEDFSPLLATAIFKSGAMLADITGLNKNVLWEMGIAQGAGRPVFLLRSRADRRELSDLSRHLTLRYDRRPPWPRSAVERLVFPLVMAQDIFRLMPKDRVLRAAGARVGHLDAYGEHLLRKAREKYGRPLKTVPPSPASRRASRRRRVRRAEGEATERAAHEGSAAVRKGSQSTVKEPRSSVTSRSR